MKDMEYFKDKVVVVTGGAQGIGRCISEEFRKAGAQVCVIDKQEGDHFVGDIADKQTLEQFAQEVIAKHGHVDYLINNALPLMKGIDACSIVNISSSRDRMSQPQTESYTAAKGGIAALTHALAVSLAERVRVNSISPGWIDTAYTVYEGDRVRSRMMFASTLPSGEAARPWSQAPMPFNSPSVVSAILWTSPTWCSSYVPTRRVSSRARTSPQVVPQGFRFKFREAYIHIRGKLNPPCDSGTFD